MIREPEKFEKKCEEHILHMLAILQKTVHQIPGSQKYKDISKIDRWGVGHFLY